MQLPTIDRNQIVPPSSTDVVVSGAGRVVPIAPVNPAVQPTPTVGAQPSVIDLVDPALKAQDAAQRVYVAVPDPAGGQSLAQAVPKDWTLHKPAPEKVETPPAKPIAQILMDHLKSMWSASASAIQVEQVHNHLAPPTPMTPTQAPGELAKQSMVYTPSKIKKNENI